MRRIRTLVILIIIILLLIVFRSTGYPQTGFKQIADKSSTSLITGKNPLKGLVIGLIKGEKYEIFTYGNVVKGKDISPEEIQFKGASITKNLTALLLAKAAADKLISYDDTAVIIAGKKISWKDLVTHTAGLPALPPDIDKSSSYSREQFNRFIKECSLESEPGKKFFYSTAGYSLLGILIAEKLGYKSFDDCLTEKILKPLGFNSSFFGDEGLKEEYYSGDPAKTKELKKDYVFNPSGGIVSTPGDFINLIRMNLYPEKFPGFETSIKLTHTIFENTPTLPGCCAALGWHYLMSMKVFTNTGVSGESRCVIMFDPVNKAGIMIMTNTPVSGQDSRLEMAGIGLIAQLRQMK
jgi:CubicO group peptidase (beta-lactamase class C family)